MIEVSLRVRQAALMVAEFCGGSVLVVQDHNGGEYRVTLPIRNCLPLGSYSRPMPRALRWSKGGGQFLMSDVPLYMVTTEVSIRHNHTFFSSHQEGKAQSQATGVPRSKEPPPP